MSINLDIGRDYCDPEGVDPHFRLRPLPKSDWSGFPTEFIVTYKGKTLEMPVWYSHLGLLKLCKQYDFDRVLDLGSHEGLCSHVFDHIGKTTVALEPYPYTTPSISGLKIRKPDIENYYESYVFDKKFDAIWCSHVLEHVRNPGNFLDKIYDDLRADGVLAITVPFNDFNDASITQVLLGHHNKYNHGLLLYQLVCAGFDCREASVTIYAGMITVIVKKKPNNVQRIATALWSGPQGDTANESNTFDNRWCEKRIYDFFPKDFKWDGTSLDYKEAFVNWNLPI